MSAWRQFRSLLPNDPLQAGQVVALNDDGTSTVSLPGAVTLRVQGQPLPLGAYAFVQGGRITGEAPVLPTVYIAV